MTGFSCSHRIIHPSVLLGQDEGEGVDGGAERERVPRARAQLRRVGHHDGRGHRQQAARAGRRAEQVRGETITVVLLSWLWKRHRYAVRWAGGRPFKV